MALTLNLCASCGAFELFCIVQTVKTVLWTVEDANMYTVDSHLVGNTWPETNYVLIL